MLVCIFFAQNIKVPSIIKNIVFEDDRKSISRGSTTDLRFVATITTGGCVKFLPTV